MKTPTIIGGATITEPRPGEFEFTSYAHIDGDGTGPSHGDPCYQRDTSLHQDGKALNADVDVYIVANPKFQKGVAGIVLGCQAEVTDLRTGITTEAVVGDIGPAAKFGEISITCAKALRIPSSPTSGGEEKRVFRYRIWPDVPAIVNGRKYELQPA